MGKSDAPHCMVKETESREGKGLPQEVELGLESRRLLSHDMEQIIHLLIHYENLYEAPTLSAERVGPLKKGEMNDKVPPLILVGHVTWFDLLGLNFPSPLMRRADDLPAQ